MPVEHPARITALVLWAVVLTRRSDVDWVTRTMGEIFPAEYEQLLDAAGPIAEGENVCLAINRLLRDSDPDVADTAAQAWCAWEDRIATLNGPVLRSKRFNDPRFRLGFTRIVTHYFGNAAFLDDDAITGRLDRIADVPRRALNNAARWARLSAGL